MAAGLRRSRLVGVLKEHEAGAATAALCRHHGMSEQTFSRWKQKYGGLDQGRLRDECLNRHWFVSLADARHIIEAWRQDYNRARPHSALGYRPPEEFRQTFETAAIRRQAWVGLS